MVKHSPLPYVFAGAIALLSSCNQKEAPLVNSAPPAQSGQLLRVGSIIVTEADLEQQLKDQHSARNDEASRQKALADLASRAQLVQAALDAGLENDPAFRAEAGRVLASRLKEKTLIPRTKELMGPIDEVRLRELYHAAQARFQSGEKRQVAVLWLNPGNDPERKKQYEEKLAGAREFLLKNPEIKDDPDKGFSVLSVDNSEHAASRYKGGVVGWLEQAGGMDEWSKAAASIAFSLKDPGEVSSVVARAEGVFLVRYMAQKPAVQRPFESVKSELEQEERRRLREKLETEFTDGIKAKNPVQWLVPPPQ